ncbi:uncharacterized protein METZ01_LOCUS2105 [marine metagenome]|uniref:Uncharacterized protein n=1 Tax=marine metagenome TaxID=408172 RepID=A0A381N3S7_9ZZZZ
MKWIMKKPSLGLVHAFRFDGEIQTYN